MRILAFGLLTVFSPSVIKNVAQGSVSRGHYSNQFDFNDPQLLALALFIFHHADHREPVQHPRLTFFYDLKKKSTFDIH